MREGQGGHGPGWQRRGQGWGHRSSILLFPHVSPHPRECSSSRGGGEEEEEGEEEGEEEEGEEEWSADWGEEEQKQRAEREEGKERTGDWQRGQCHMPCESALAEAQAEAQGVWKRWKHVEHDQKGEDEMSRRVRQIVQS